MLLKEAEDDDDEDIVEDAEKVCRLLFIFEYAPFIFFIFYHFSVQHFLCADLFCLKTRIT